MSRRNLLGSLAILFLAGLIGCNEPDTITNQIEPPGGAIYGRVSPAETGTEVAAWQAVEIKSTTVDAEGYFTITDLPPGLYTVVVRAPSGLRRDIRDVAVDRTRSISLGLVVLNDSPGLFRSFYPADGDSGISFESSISFTTVERLDVSSLASAVQISPPRSGSWYESFLGPEAFAYTLRTFPESEALEPSTAYSVSIGPELVLSSGSTWGQTYSYTFWTEAFRLVEWQFRSKLPVHPLFIGRLVLLGFNATLNTASFDQSIRIEPAVEITFNPSYNFRSVDVYVASELLPGTQYHLIIEETLTAEAGHQKGVVDTLAFVTQPLAVSSVRFGPSNGAPIPPESDLSASITMNARIDVDALNNASSFSPPVPGFWIEQYVREGQGHFLNFFPSSSSNLIPNQEYKFTIDGSTVLSNGLSLGEDYTATFVVDPVRVSSVSPSNGTQNVSTLPYIRVNFNAPMNRGATEAAFSLHQLSGGPVAGTFSWGSTSNNFSFRPSAALQADRTYVVEVGNTAESEGGSAVDTAWSSVFRTQ